MHYLACKVFWWNIRDARENDSRRRLNKSIFKVEKGNNIKHTKRVEIIINDKIQP